MSGPSRAFFCSKFYPLIVALSSTIFLENIILNLVNNWDLSDFLCGMWIKNHSELSSGKKEGFWSTQNLYLSFLYLHYIYIYLFIYLEFTFNFSHVHWCNVWSFICTVLYTILYCTVLYCMLFRCVQQDNEQLARSGISCLENLVLSNGDKFNAESWDSLCQVSLRRQRESLW